ncbi:hypothetical protein ONZ51_g8153 [Trametes cubensis]|uniref:Uncharacterized protein n=1 Tax=Trametes cubensis TaxID=1111947 RepID=A0AAD7X8U4_9APHY|nr:hypothetical protein ONZ51_g8153 [Trametes cubensis]
MSVTGRPILLHRVYRLHKRWLADNFTYFAQKFGPGGDDSWITTVLEEPEVAEGCTVYHTPSEVPAEDFERILHALKNQEQKHGSSAASRTAGTQLLVAAQALGCDTIVTQERERLCTVWNERKPPRPESYRNYRPPESAYPPNDEPHSFEEAREMIRLGRNHGLRKVLKRAYYELVSSSEFESALKDPGAFGFSRAEMKRLSRVQGKLMFAWHRAVRKPPRDSLWRGSHCHPLARSPLPYGCKQQHGAIRRSAWRNMMNETGEAAEGARDPPSLQRLPPHGRAAEQPVVLVLCAGVGEVVGAAARGVVGGVQGTEAVNAS